MKGEPMKTGTELIKEIQDCSPKEGSLAFWWLGQRGYAIKLGDWTVYIDMFLSDRHDRNIPPLLKPEDVNNAHFIIGSHDHSDHIDRKVWRRLHLSSPNARFIVPKVHITSLSNDLDIPKDRFIGLDDRVSIDLQGLKITGIASAHEFLDRDPITGSYPCLGYVIEGNGCTIYHSGDTCMYEGLQKKLMSWDKIDVMFVPINGRDGRRYRKNIIGNMTYQEAVDLAGTIKPGLVVPGHYEMFSSNSEDPELFADYIGAKYPDVKYWIGKHGEKVIVDKIS